MPRYLSPEWLEAAQAALATIAREAGAQEAGPLVVQHVVTGCVGGEVTYHLRVDDEGVRIEPGAAETPTVVFTEDYATAASIARGELSAQGAFMTGHIRVRGDLPQLVARSDVFDGIDDVLAPLRAETSY